MQAVQRGVVADGHAVRLGSGQRGQPDGVAQLIRGQRCAAERLLDPSGSEDLHGARTFASHFGMVRRLGVSFDQKRADTDGGRGGSKRTGRSVLHRQ